MRDNLIEVYVRVNGIWSGKKYATTEELIKKGRTYLFGKNVSISDALVFGSQTKEWECLASHDPRDKKPFTLRKIRELMRDGYLFEGSIEGYSKQIDTMYIDEQKICLDSWYTLAEFCGEFKAIDLDGNKMELKE